MTQLCDVGAGGFGITVGNMKGVEYNTMAELCLYSLVDAYKCRSKSSHQGPPRCCKWSAFIAVYFAGAFDLAAQSRSNSPYQFMLS